MATKLEGLFSDYAAYHQTAGNKACHYVGIPLIVFTGLGMLSYASAAAPVTVAALSVVYYLTLSGRLSVAMAAALLVMCAVASRVPIQVHLAGFIVGWIFQFVGHYVYEKRSPAFYRNLQHLLIGPLWVVARFLPQRPTESVHSV